MTIKTITQPTLNRPTERITDFSMKELDKFFGDVMGDLDKLTITPPLSNCCSAKVFGELFKNFGRCSDCYEMAEFTPQKEEV